MTQLTLAFYIGQGRIENRLIRTNDSFSSLKKHFASARHIPNRYLV